MRLLKKLSHSEETKLFDGFVDCQKEEKSFSVSFAENFFFFLFCSFPKKNCGGGDRNQDFDFIYVNYLTYFLMLEFLLF